MNRSPFKNDYLKAAKVILSEQLGFNEDEITPDKNLSEDLGADSLDQVEIVMAFEEEFDFDIPDEDVEGFKTVADIVSYLERILTTPASDD